MFKIFAQLNARAPLAVKLAGALIAVVLLSGGTAFWLTRQAMHEVFRAFTLQSGIIQAYQLQQTFVNYYERVGSWRGVDTSLALLSYHANLILADEQGVALLAPDPRWVGRKLPDEALTAGVPINAGGRRVGTLVAGALEDSLNPLEQTFLNSLNGSLLTASVLAALAAMALGILFLRQLTISLRRLAHATEQISRGNTRLRLPVHSHDELGQLSAAFNRMAERLEKSEKLRRQMIADIAHELRTPLTVIQGDLQAILDGVYQPTPEVIASIHEESTLLARLVNDLHELSLAETGELRLEKRPADMREIVQRAVTVIDPQVRARNIAIELELPQGPVPVEIDAQRIEQVLLNLLSNAERYTPIGGQIRVALTVHKSNAIVQISDTGPGINPEDLPYIFERFWRASRPRATGGTGLGLAIAKHFVEAHGGRIWAESTPGKGATLTFSLPLPWSAGALH